MCVLLAFCLWLLASLVPLSLYLSHSKFAHRQLVNNALVNGETTQQRTVKVINNTLGKSGDRLNYPSFTGQNNGPYRILNAVNELVRRKESKKVRTHIWNIHEYENHVHFRLCNAIFETKAKTKTITFIEHFTCVCIISKSKVFFSTSRMKKSYCIWHKSQVKHCQPKWNSGKNNHFEKQVWHKSDKNIFYGLIKQMKKKQQQRDETVNCRAIVWCGTWKLCSASLTGINKVCLLFYAFHSSIG